MPRAALTDEQIDTFRHRTVQVASALFVEHGYEGVSMRRVAQALGVSAMTAYRYFANKEALFIAVRTAAFERFGDALAAVADEERADRLPQLGAAYLRFATTQPHAYRIMFELEQPSADPFPALQAAQTRAFRFLRDATADAIGAGHLRGDAETVAHLLWAQVHGLASLHLSGKLTGSRSLDELAAALTFGTYDTAAPDVVAPANVNEETREQA